MTTPKQKSNYRQEAYDSHVFAKGDALERLREQWAVIGLLDWPPTRADHGALQKAVVQIDVQLTRYALSSLCSQLEEAAVCDIARLVAEVVLDTSSTQDALKRLEAWLGTAPCWTAMARENWPEAVRQAANKVVAALNDAGVQLDAKAEAELAAKVGRLEIEDLLPQATIERLFPPDSKAREW